MVNERLERLRRVMSDEDAPMRVVEHKAEPKTRYNMGISVEHPPTCVVCARYGVTQPIQRRGPFRRWRHVR